ncbi:MAG: ImmA/IrrE family metallo-endopeptidase [Bdellovibrionaceae bacterium]|nr:ImmA/IrrE family metallo-endopeptidase [Bdellovibrio sp.]
MKNLVYLFLFLIVSCSYPKGSPAPALSDDSIISNAFAELRKYPTGIALLNQIDQLRNKGVNIETRLQRAADLKALAGNTISDSTVQSNSGQYYIMINEELSSAAKAHALAHELTHVLDDVEIDEVFKYRSDVETIVAYTFQRMQAGETNNLNRAHVSYVISSKFCAEARAFSSNQKLIRDGLSDEKMHSVISQLATHIDANYIQPLGTRFGANSQTMLNWCLTEASMTSIQNNLIYNYIDQ